MATTTLTLDDELEARIEKLAEERGQPADVLVRDAVSQYVDRVEKARADFLREAEESWEDFQRTGLHLTGEEVLAWLETWGTEDEKDLPERHT